ncbi:MAG TPA: CHAT domain-containing protein, partial [Iamia sp.]|nr:CHAT domain-containing protein [Iamia sp.]
MSRSWVAVEVDGVAHLVAPAGGRLVVTAADRGTLGRVRTDPGVRLVAAPGDPVVVEQRDRHLVVADVVVRGGKVEAEPRPGRVRLAAGEKVLAVTVDADGLTLLLTGSGGTVLATLVGGRLDREEVVTPGVAVSGAFHLGRPLVVTENGPDRPTAAVLGGLGTTVEEVTALAVARSAGRTYLAVAGLGGGRPRFDLREVGDDGLSATGSRAERVEDVVVVTAAGEGRVDVVLVGAGIEVRDAVREGDDREVVVDMATAERGAAVIAVNHAGGDYDRLVLRYPADGWGAGALLPEYDAPVPTDTRAVVSVAPLGLIEGRSVVRRVAGARGNGWDTTRRDMVVGVVNLLADGRDRDAVAPSLSSEQIFEVPATPTTYALRVRRFDLGDAAAGGDGRDALLDGANRLDVVYVIGHGHVRDGIPGIGSVPDGGWDLLTAAELAPALAAAGTQLVVLRACSSARDTPTHWSLAAELHIAGVPIVVG